MGILIFFFAFSESTAPGPFSRKAPLPKGTVFDAVTRRPRTPAYKRADQEFRMGEIYRQRREYSGALQLYRSALSFYPEHLEARDREGFCLWKLGDLSAAETSFRRALEIDPAFYRSHFYLGRILAKSGRWKEAVGAMSQAWHKSPKRDFFVGYEYAQLLYQLGYFPEALEILGELRERFPSNAQAEILRMKITQAEGRP